MYAPCDERGVVDVALQRAVVGAGLGRSRGRVDGPDVAVNLELEELLPVRRRERLGLRLRSILGTWGKGQERGVGNEKQVTRAVCGDAKSTGDGETSLRQGAKED